MKKLFIAIAILFSTSVIGQSYGDSLITLTLTQRTAYWIGQYVKTSFTWSERNAPSQLENYIGSGTNPDSLIVSVTFKSKFLFGAIDGLISQPLQVAYTDYRKIMLNQPSVVGYTALPSQVTTKANNLSDPQHLTAQWLSEQYQARTAAFDALYNEQKASVITWSRE